MLTGFSQWPPQTHPASLPYFHPSNPTSLPPHLDPLNHRPLPAAKRPRLAGSREKQHVPMYAPELSKKKGRIVNEMKGIG